MAANAVPTAEHKLELAQLIVQFLKHEITNNAALADSQREGLEVAIDCIDQAYKTGAQEPSTKLMQAHIASKEPRTGAPNITDLVAMLQQMGPSLMPMLAPLLQQFTNNGPQQQQQQQQQPQTEAPATSRSASAPTQQEPPRKQASAEEKRQAEELKNRGNDLMKDDEYKLAYDAYTEAIKLDNNNAVYYSNRAAASSKLGNHQDALRDCEEAIKIDPTYSKAYGRQGLAYVNLNDHAKARDAYREAVKYDPNNESYQNNLALATQKAEQAASANPMMNLLNSVTQGGGAFDEWMQNPQMQNAYQMFCSMVSPNNNPNQNQQQPPPGTS